MKPLLRRWGLPVGVVLLSLGAGGGLTMVAGVVPIKASSGHWSVTASFLQFAKRRSVSTHTLWAEPVQLDEPWLVLKGAGHYENGCRPCHGSPELREPPVAAAMTPRPPYLGTTVQSWAPEELSYIVKHGIKFTGMPAWPSANREDEVHALVAFILKLPDMDAAKYRELVHGGGSGDPRAPLTALGDPPPPVTAQSCTRCHGPKGEGRGSAAFPRLAGQRPQYLAHALEAYAQGRRHSGIMRPFAVPLSPDEIRELSSYYARMSRAAPEPQGDASAVDRGRAIAEHGIPGQGVPACADCHGPREGPRNPAYPILAGQFSGYLELQLRLFHTTERGGSAYAHIMNNVASRLKPEQMRDVAAYYAGATAATLDSADK